MVKKFKPPLQSVLPEAAPRRFPSTRYQGSKGKLLDAIWSHLANLDFETCLDAFGGTGAVSYRFKQAGKRVTFNDYLRANTTFAVGLVENDKTLLTESEINRLLNPETEARFPSLVQNEFQGIYYTDEENAWIDRTLFRIRQLTDKYAYALAFFALCQACIVKRPYNLFHRHNLHLRLADVPRSFGNKTSWDRPFEVWFRMFAAEANGAIFAGAAPSACWNKHVADLNGDFDLIYLDPPYISQRGMGVDYEHYYHFIEGLSRYDDWPELIDRQSKHRKMIAGDNPWIDRKRIHAAFDDLLGHFPRGILVISYRSDGIPSIDELRSLLRRHREIVDACSLGSYKYALSTNKHSREFLFIAR